MNQENALKERLYHRVMEQVDFGRSLEDDEILTYIDGCVEEESKQQHIPLKDMLKLRRELFHSFRKLDLLSELLEDDEITEIMINGYQQVFVEKAGHLYQLDRQFSSEEKLQDVVQQIVSACNRMVNAAHPIADATIMHGNMKARVNIILPPVSLNGATVTIRRFAKEPITMEKLIALESLSEAARDVLRLLVECGYNIFISGGTGSGKTTFLNALSGFIPSDERIITIEDVAELQIPKTIRNQVHLEAREANVEGENAITIRDMIKASLRMRPDRIIVGEVRDGAALDMLTAMNTGHDGSLSTGHANSTRDMLRRLETMVMMGADLPIKAIQGQIASAIDIVVHLGRLRDKRRCVLEICEVLGVQDGTYLLRTLFSFQEMQTENGESVKGRLVWMEDLANIDKLERGGKREEYEAIKARYLSCSSS